MILKFVEKRKGLGIRMVSLPPIAYQVLVSTEMPQVAKSRSRDKARSGSN